MFCPLMVFKNVLLIPFGCANGANIHNYIFVIKYLYPMVKN